MINEYFSFRESCSKRNIDKLLRKIGLAMERPIDVVIGESNANNEISADEGNWNNETDSGGENAPCNQAEPLICGTVADSGVEDAEALAKSPLHESHVETLSTKSKTKSSVKEANKQQKSTKFSVKCGWRACVEMFESKSAVKYHIATFHPKLIKKKFECYLCKKKLSEKKTLFPHMNAFHSHQNQFTCPFSMCTKIFYTKDVLDTHTKRRHAKKMVFVAKRKPPAISNVATGRDILKYPVDCAWKYCKEVFESEDAMNYHAATSHAKGITKTYACYLCKKKCSEKNSLLQHLNAMHGRQQKFKCPIPGCLTVFQFSTGIAEHMKFVHGKRPGSAGPAKRKQLSYGKEVNRHFPVKCAKTTCSHAFECRDAMVYHMTRYHRQRIQKTIECYICKKTFRFRHWTWFQGHMNGEHTHRKSFKCPLPDCPRVFYQKNSIYWHVRKKHASKAMATERNRMRLVDAIDDNGQNNDSFPVKCAWQICPSLFENENEMLNHVTQFHRKRNKKSFECHLCKKVFEERNRLEKHMNSDHSHQRSFPCPNSMCSRICYSQRELQRHMISCNENRAELSTKSKRSTNHK